jgi:hypothetical protein
MGGSLVRPLQPNLCVYLLLLLATLVLCAIPVSRAYAKNGYHVHNGIAYIGHRNLGPVMPDAQYEAVLKTECLGLAAQIIQFKKEAALGETDTTAFGAIDNTVIKTIMANYHVSRERAVQMQLQAMDRPSDLNAACREVWGIQ